METEPQLQPAAIAHKQNPILRSLWTFSPAIRTTMLILTAGIAFLVRIFSVIKYESIIHEFDPWFNYRATRYLEEKGREEFLYWFDVDSWYPLGRFVGHTVFPGLMFTSVILSRILKYMLIPMDIKYICVFIAPFFSTITTFCTYAITKEITDREESGLLAALFISVIPSYLSRSVAGSYDNEAISITQLMLTFYFFIKASKSGSYIYAALCALSYSYLVASWGGYSFVITFIPVFVLATLITKRYTLKIYLAYSVFYIIGSFWAMQTKFVEFKVWHTSEHLGSHFVFLLVQGHLVYSYLSKALSSHQFNYLKRTLIYGALIGVIAVIVYLGLMGKTHFSERVMTLIDPTYAKSYIPIVASVSEHQPTAWTTFFFDLHFTLLFAPLGLYYALRRADNYKLFISLYLVVGVYFASLMVRLLLILAPALCILSGIGVSGLLRDTLKVFVERKKTPVPQNDSKPSSNETSSALKLLMKAFSILTIILISMLLLKYMLHGSMIGAEVYSSPTVILSNRNYETGEKHIIDDFREAYYWLRQNSVERSKVLSWWDYGYQIAGFSNRTTIVDNNTWNFTHIAYVGRVLASSEDDAYDILENLDVDYVMVQFGGRTGFGGDDINKFLWIVRIVNNAFPHIKEADYVVNGYAIDGRISPAMKNSIMYKLCYYRFWEEDTGRGKGFDLVRNTKIGYSHYKLKYFEEVFTSQRWLVRIYKRKRKNNRENIAFTPKNIYDSPQELDKSLIVNDEYDFIG